DVVPHRQVVEDAALERGGVRGVLHVNRGRRAGDRQFLAPAAQLQVRVERGRLVGVDADVLVRDSLETLQRERDLILARAEVLYEVLTLAVCNCGFGALDKNVALRFHRHTRQRATRRVLDDAASLLRVRDPRNGQQTGQNRER